MELPTTSPASATSPRSARLAARAGGFTLIELLVVVTIIGILAALVLPALVRSYNQAKKIRQAADIQSISSALEAYFGDFHAYPRVDTAGTGADVLGWALIGPGPVAQDGLDGPGFRARPGGKIYKPLLPTDTVVLRPLPGTAILDKQAYRPLDIAGAGAAGSHPPILYFPALATRPNINQPNSFVSNVPGAVALFNYLDNNIETDLTFEAMKKMLGDYSPVTPAPATSANGQIDPGEKPATMGPYLLWSAGPDGRFGFDAKGKTDDVTNFDIPTDLKR